MVFLIALVVNFLSLLIVVQYKKKNISVLFTNPAFLIGDFFLIPAYFMVSREISIFVLPVSFFIVVLWGKRHQLLEPIWFPHGLVALAIISVLLTAIFNENIQTIITLSVILGTHQFLTLLWPKKI